MANIRSANTFYVDTQYSSGSDELAIKNIKVYYVMVTATAASGRLVLADSVTGTVKGDFRVVTSGASQVFDFRICPIAFPNGIKPTTLTNAVATLVIDETRG